MADPVHEGGCLCGAVRYRASGRADNPCFCHCRSCRGASGAACVAWGTFPRAGFRITAGELRGYPSSPDVARGFCATCGTALTYAHRRRPEEVDVALASLDDPSRLAPAFHIWVSHALPWSRPCDGLPAYDEWKTGSP